MKRRHARPASSPPAAPVVTARAASLPQRRFGLLLLAIGLEVAWLAALALLAWWS